MEKAKIEKANIILKEMVKNDFKESSWVYIDFVKEDRFLNEIKNDKNINISESTSEELAEYAYEMIDNSNRLSSLFWF